MDYYVNLQYLQMPKVASLLISSLALLFSISVYLITGFVSDVYLEHTFLFLINCEYIYKLQIKWLLSV